MLCRGKGPPCLTCSAIATCRKPKPQTLEACRSQCSASEYVCVCVERVYSCVCNVCGRVSCRLTGDALGGEGHVAQQHASVDGEVVHTLCSATHGTTQQHNTHGGCANTCADTHHSSTTHGTKEVCATPCHSANITTHGADITVGTRPAPRPPNTVTTTTTQPTPCAGSHTHGGSRSHTPAPPGPAAPA